MNDLTSQAGPNWAARTDRRPVCARNRRPSLVVPVLGLLMALVAAGCGSATDSAGSRGETETEPTETAANGTTQDDPVADDGAVEPPGDPVGDDGAEEPSDDPVTETDLLAGVGSCTVRPGPDGALPLFDVTLTAGATETASYRVTVQMLDEAGAPLESQFNHADAMFYLLEPGQTAIESTALLFGEASGCRPVRVDLLDAWPVAAAQATCLVLPEVNGLGFAEVDVMLTNDGDHPDLVVYVGLLGPDGSRVDSEQAIFRTAPPGQSAMPAIVHAPPETVSSCEVLAVTERPTVRP